MGIKKSASGLMPHTTWKKMWLLQNKICNARDKKELVTTFFREVRTLIPHRSATYFPIDIPTQVPSPTGHIALNFPHYAEAGKKYGEYYHALDPLKDRSLPSNMNKPAKTTDFVSPENITAGEYYNDFLKPLGIAYNLGCQVAFNGRSVGGIGFHRGLDDKDFTERDKAILSHLAPALAYSLYNMEIIGRMSDTLRTVKKRVDDTNGVEQMAAWVLDANLVNVLQSDGAKKLTEKWTTAKSQDKSAIPAFPEQVMEILHNAKSKSGKSSGASSGSNRVLVEFDGKNYLFTALAISSDKKADLGKVLLTVEVMTQREKVFDSYQSFGFTPREKEVAMLLAQGLKNNEIAKQLCLSVNTVKGHLKSIFEKTGVDSRAGLISLLFISSNAK